MAELLEDVQAGTIDRISPTVGMRFPGGALDEQQAILNVVRNAAEVDWKLRWALLEIFQCGDRRHINDYAEEYAKIINQAQNSNEAREMFQRMSFVLGAEVSVVERAEFAKYFNAALNPERRIELPNFIKQYYSADTPNQPADAAGSEQKSEAAADGKSSLDEDSFFWPGLFGRGSAMKVADGILKTAEQQFRLRNYEAARAEAVRVLETLQDGGWSIWGRLSKEATRAEELLGEGDIDGNDLIRWYGSLIEGEQYDAKWKIADHLIEKITNRLSADERHALLDSVIEHVDLMVGNARHEIEIFEFLKAKADGDLQRILFGFVLWLLDHPHWLRRDKAAGLILWLIEGGDAYFGEVARIAFSNVPSYGGDIAGGAIDAFSSRQSTAVWSRLVAAVDLPTVIADCKHVGRITMLLRIAERAARSGSQDAGVVAASIVEKFRTGVIDLETSTDYVARPRWISCISSELREIEQLGLLTKELLVRLEEELATICAPLSVTEAWDIEKSLATSFHQSMHHRLNRWEGKVRFSLGRALFSYVSQRDFRQIESALRIYNPNAPERTLVEGFASRGKEIIQAIEDGKDYRNAIGSSDSYYLNYYEAVLDRDEVTGKEVGRLIEVLAVVMPNSGTGKEAFRAAMAASVGSRDFPDFNVGGTIGPTCLRLIPEFAYFGSFTPAFPWSFFIDLIKANGEEFSRISWRDGRSYEVGNIGRPEHEGCCLAMKRSALQLPPEMNLVWIIHLDGKLEAVVDINNKRLD